MEQPRLNLPLEFKLYRGRAQDVVQELERNEALSNSQAEPGQAIKLAVA